MGESVIKIFFYIFIVSDLFKVFSTLKTERDSSFVYKSYQTTIYCNPSDPIQYPKSTEDVQKLVQVAIQKGKTVKVVGSHHSITDIICTEGVPLSLRHIDHAVDNEDETATLGAGMLLEDAFLFLEQRNKTLIHGPTFSGITVGGAIATGAHGSTLLHPASLSDQVVAVSIIDGMGNLRLITEPEEINAFRVNLGLLGIIVEVTLQTVPLFKMLVSNTIHQENILLDDTSLSLAHEYDLFQMWWFPSLKEVVVSKGTYLKGTNDAGNARTNFIPDLDPVLRNYISVGLEGLQRAQFTPALQAFEAFTKTSLLTKVVGKPPIFTDSPSGTLIEPVTNPAIGIAWRLFANRCTSCAWIGETPVPILPEESCMAFDIKEFSGVIQMISRVLSQYPAAFYMTGVYIRFSKASSGLLSIANGRYTFTVEWTTAMRKDRYETARDKIGAYQWILQEMVQNYGGRPHWGKNGLYYFNKKFLASLPHHAAFVQAMAKYDPNGVFLNKFGWRLLGLSDDMDVDPNVRRCALQDYCICKTDTDCGVNQNCVEMGGFNLCKDRINLVWGKRNVFLGDMFSYNASSVSVQLNVQNVSLPH